MKTKTTPTLEIGCFIRTKYRGQWEYAVLKTMDGTRTIICAQDDLERWQQGEPIKPLFEPCAPDLQEKAKRWKEQLRDGTDVIECVWKGDRLEPRRTARS